MGSEHNGRIEKNDRCCGESGTFAVTRPDIATQVRFRKQQEMERGAARVHECGHPMDGVAHALRVSTGMGNVRAFE